MPPPPAPRVLIVEDEVVVAMFLEDTLADLGYAVAGSATSLDEGLAAARGAALDAALLDVNLAGRESFPIAAVLRGRGVPFLFVTSYGPAGIQPAYRDAPVLTKPVDPAALGRALKGIIERGAAP